MKLFYEKYIKLAHIGKGANAHVYKVRHAELGYVRAIKILNEDIESKGERAYQSFLKECKTLLAIGNGAHPNIIRIYGPDLIDNHAIVEMDYVQGTTLDSYIKNKGFLDYEEVKIFIHDIVGALAYTHHDIYKFLMNPEEDDLQPDPNDGHKYVITPEKEAELVKKYGIAHNDLHSNNVMRRDYDGSFVLLDFGLAVQDGECIKSSRKSDGHPEYMAPEKFDSGDITPHSDVYSLGVLIYEALTGRPPFILDYDADGKVSYPALSKICNEQHNQTPPPIVSLRKSAFEKQIPGTVYERDYPEWLDNVVMKCLAKKPEERFANAKELWNEIDEHLKNEILYNREAYELKEPIASPDLKSKNLIGDNYSLYEECQNAKEEIERLNEQLISFNSELKRLSTLNHHVYPTAYADGEANSSDLTNRSSNDTTVKPLFKKNRNDLIIGVVNNEPNLSLTLRNWFSSNYNWLYTISITVLIISGLICITQSQSYTGDIEISYGDIEILGMLSLCIGITSIVLHWILKTIPTVWIILLFTVLIASLITIIVLSSSSYTTTQIALAFISLLTFSIAYARNISPLDK